MLVAPVAALQNPKLPQQQARVGKTNSRQRLAFPPNNALLRCTLLRIHGREAKTSPPRALLCQMVACQADHHGRGQVQTSETIFASRGTRRDRANAIPHFSPISPHRRGHDGQMSYMRKTITITPTAYALPVVGIKPPIQEQGKKPHGWFFPR